MHLRGVSSICILALVTLGSLKPLTSLPSTNETDQVSETLYFDGEYNLTARRSPWPGTPFTIPITGANGDNYGQLGITSLGATGSGFQANRYHVFADLVGKRVNSRHRSVIGIIQSSKPRQSMLFDLIFDRSDGVSVPDDFIKTILLKTDELFSQYGIRGVTIVLQGPYIKSEGLGGGLKFNLNSLPMGVLEAPIYLDVTNAATPTAIEIRYAGVRINQAQKASIGQIKSRLQLELRELAALDPTAPFTGRRTPFQVQGIPYQFEVQRTGHSQSPTNKQITDAMNTWYTFNTNPRYGDLQIQAFQIFTGDGTSTRVLANCYFGWDVNKISGELNLPLMVDDGMINMTSSNVAEVT